MSLKHILLGMLAEPASGYDLKKEFDRSLRNFWHAELSQIYPGLNRLEDEGLLTSHQEESPSGPPRRVYRRAAAGRKAVLDWLQSGPQIGRERMSYLAQVYFLGEFDDPDEAFDFMRRLREHTAARLAKLESIEREWRAGDPRYPDELPDADFYAQLTLALGLKRVRAMLEWCDESLARMEARA
ncbi:MAG: PadR family transcriptional regulator [Woeseiaceae bacterium]|nr:PadR family transcriptional regulator [Woeseiaceae bacterium]